jgi:hypothetical protein
MRSYLSRKAGGGLNVKRPRVDHRFHALQGGSTLPARSHRQCILLRRPAASLTKHGDKVRIRYPASRSDCDAWSDGLWRQ